MLADQIAKLIEEMLEEGGGSLDLRRNEMAAALGCVPSQISYVITSRFTPERGYIIESHRGGGGHIRAAGCSVDGTLEEAKAAILDATERAIPCIGKY